MFLLAFLGGTLISTFAIAFGQSLSLHQPPLISLKLPFASLASVLCFKKVGFPFPEFYRRSSSIPRCDHVSLHCSDAFKLFVPSSSVGAGGVLFGSGRSFVPKSPRMHARDIGSGADNEVLFSTSLSHRSHALT